MKSHLTITVLQFLFSIILLIIIIIKNKRIKQLVEDNNTIVEKYTDEIININKENSSKDKRIADKLTSQENTIINLHYRLNFCIYILSGLNKYWYRSLKIYNPEQSLIPLRLSIDKENAYYKVNAYVGSEDLSEKTDFLIPTNKQAANSSRLSNLIPRLSDVTSDLSDFPGIVEVNQYIADINQE